MIRSLLLSSLCAAAFPLVARAHAGVPIATDVQFVKHNGQKVPAYSTTFGLLMQDSAGDWRLTCEETKELGRKLFKVWPDGEIGMAYTSGYAYSTDGCSFTRAQGVSASARSLETADFADSTPPVLVLLTDMTDAQEPGTNLFVSGDRGRTFQQVHLPKAINIISMVVSKTTPPRIVLTGDLSVEVEDGDPKRERWLLSSSACLLDAACAETDWSLVELASTDVQQGITRVLADLPEGLFLRNVTGDVSSLLRSTDHAEHFTKVLPAGSNSLPNAVDFLSRTAPGELWLSAGLQQTYQSSDGGATWTRRPELGDVRCVQTDGSAVHGCVVDLPGNTVATSSTDQGANWAPALRYDQVAGIRSCPAGSDVAVACDDLWLLISLTFKGQQTNPPIVTPSPDVKKKGCSSSDPVAIGAIFVLIRGGRSLRRRRG